MPELPEVETTVRALRQPLIGSVITAVSSDWPRQIITPDLAELRARIDGRRIQAINRRGKYLVFTLDGRETLIIHLKMSGHLAVVDAGAPPSPYVHTVFSLADGRELRFRDTRKFGRVYLVENPAEILGKLGPEPLSADFTVAVLAQRLASRKRAIKPVLLDQTIIAGIGNIYADESLFYARIDPRRAANTLSPADTTRLHTAIQKALQLGIDREGASINSYVKPDGRKGEMQNAVVVFRRTGEPCYECCTPVQRIVLGGRSTHFCPHCQQ